LAANAANPQTEINGSFTFRDAAGAGFTGTAWNSR
jgi:hypothetical protein